MQSKISFCITSFLRPNAVYECLNRIRQYHPNEKIIVADQLPEDEKYKERLLNYSQLGDNVKLINLPFDCGASFSRNRLTEAVETEYCVLMDDDMFLKNDKLSDLIAFLENSDLDICGGLLENPDGTIEKWDGKLWIEDDCLHFEPVTIQAPFTYVDIIPNFFIGKTERLLRVPWCEQYKVGREHLDFFWQVKLAGLKVGLSPIIIAEHVHYRDSEYNSFRFNKQNIEFHNQLLLKRLNVNSIKSSTYVNLPKA